MPKLEVGFTSLGGAVEYVRLLKTFEEERELTVVFLFDLSASMDGGFGLWSARQMAARVCACLALSAVMNNDKVGLLTFCDEVIDYFKKRAAVPWERLRGDVDPLWPGTQYVDPRRGDEDFAVRKEGCGVILALGRHAPRRTEPLDVERL